MDEIESQILFKASKRSRESFSREKVSSLNNKNTQIYSERLQK